MRTTLALLAVLSFSVLAGDIDRSIADFRTPEQIRWVRNPAGTNEQAILFAIRRSPARTWCGCAG
jgi:hypothetical protein